MNNNNNIFPGDATPDLSGFNGAFPKTYKVKKPVKAMNKIGPRTEAWLNGHPKLKADFESHNIVTCEILPHVRRFHKKLLKKYGFGKCKTDYLLGFAHKIPRSYYNVNEIADPHVVVLAEEVCHNIVDRDMPLEEAADLMQEIIDGREW